jgi:hypothetical protein
MGRYRPFERSRASSGPLANTAWVMVATAGLDVEVVAMGTSRIGPRPGRLASPGSSDGDSVHRPSVPMITQGHHHLRDCCPERCSYVSSSFLSGIFGFLFLLPGMVIGAGVADRTGMGHEGRLL